METAAAALVVCAPAELAGRNTSTGSVCYPVGGIDYIVTLDGELRGHGFISVPLVAGFLNHRSVKKMRRLFLWNFFLRFQRRRRPAAAPNRKERARGVKECRRVEESGRGRPFSDQ